MYIIIYIICYAQFQKFVSCYFKNKQSLIKLFSLIGFFPNLAVLSTLATYVYIRSILLVLFEALHIEGELSKNVGGN